MSKQFDVCIRGSGVVGQTLALLLARERLRVAMVSKVSPAIAGQAGPDGGAEASGDVRAFALNGASKRLLEDLRAWPQTPAPTAVLEMQVWGDDGARLDFSAREALQPALAWIVEVASLERQLKEAVRYQPQIEIVDTPVKAPLQVVCEGQKSSSRNEFGATWTVKPYPQKAIAARMVSTQAHLGVARQWFQGGDILALLPASSTDAGSTGNSVALIWSVSSERADVLQKLPADDFCAALQAVCGDAAGALKLDSARSSWPLALSNADRWVGPGWALAGDAAHTVHPLAGQGLNLGLADASMLAKVVGEREYWRALGDEKLLRRYERARRADIAAMGAVTDGLHGLFAQTDSRWQALRQWGMKGFSHSGMLKSWVMRQASGL
jgi:2-polyprenyl-6-methoxyphenol hydroxylase-like FAD-dependent oxidoreductase